MKPPHSNILLTNEHINYRQNALWIRIENYAIDDANAVIPFSKKMAQTENWTDNFTRDAIQEYKRFVYLCCIAENGASPSIVVDKVWHMHLLYTTEYWKNFCPNILQRELHHFPNVGGIIDYKKHHDWYLETLILYIKVFKQNPPAEFWRIPPELTPFLYSDKISATQPPLKASAIKIAPAVYYLTIVIPFILTWLLFGELPLLNLSVFQYFVLFTPLLFIIRRLVAMSEKRHLKPVIRNLPLYNRYQLAYLSGGYNNAFLLLVNDLVENNWIKIRDTKKEFAKKYFSLIVDQTSAFEDQNFIQPEVLFQSMDHLYNKSKFSLPQLASALSEYLHPIATVQTAAPEKDAILYPVWLALSAMIICCFPAEEVNLFTGFLYGIFFFMWFISIVSWQTPDSDHTIMGRALKKQMRALNNIRTIHQQAIILNRFNGVFDIPLFKKTANFFNDGGNCGATRPSCGCGC
ncbi:hypothetical protein SAMN05518672_1011335 [Chitinophaga sp. CF118]|uniref:glycine-rich domain-containing protein n=1 Tax=Chitinophaga sp. CF118 TaxID=1884367 RepID=UPI0008DEC042|nr:hypothetical protein [Chitinophaga sp. CF118]SFD26236.1 hypothetical protein SAMN05518672_1011335 [Chitinophaga sp. CF118]